MAPVQNSHPIVFVVTTNMLCHNIFWRCMQIDSINIVSKDIKMLEKNHLLLLSILTASLTIGYFAYNYKSASVTNNEDSESKKEE